MMGKLRTISGMIEQVLLPWADDVSSRPTLTAIRSALVVTLPLMFLGSLAELLNSFPLPSYQTFMAAHFGPDWMLFGTILKDATFSVMSLMMVFSLAHHLTLQFNGAQAVLRANPVIAGLVAFTSFFCLLQPDGDALPLRWLGVAGLFVAILVGIVATRLFLFLFSFKRLHLHLPGGASDIAVPQAFNALVPGMLTVLAFAACGTLMLSETGISLHEAVYRLLRWPFDSIGPGLGRGMMYILSLHGLWFAGVHGSNVLDPITHDIYGAAMLANEAAAAAGLPLPYVMTKTLLDTFVFMGGAGTGISLALALVFWGRTQASRRIGLIALVPGVFNINEVLLFGLPIVLNPLMFIPFLLSPLLLAAVAYVAVASGLVPGTGVDTQWTTPILLNGYLSTGSLRGTFLQIVNIGLGMMVYAPFVLLASKIRVKQSKVAFQRLFELSCSPAGESRHVLDHTGDAGSLARSLIVDLEYDCAHGRGLYLEFQPQIASDTGRVVGVEALIRWRHASYGSVPAPITVALAEDSGLIGPIGLWVFDTACAVRRDWLDRGIEDLAMSVNVSALQLRRGFPEKLLERLRAHGLPPALVGLEVTESVAFDEDTPESRILTRLYEAGLPLAIDDFGMGHSSLKYLKQFPVSAVKIDGAISREVVTNPICRDIVASITRLCRARRMTSVAEFVEDDAQAAILRRLGCDVFQGYRYSRPLLAEDCLRFIRETNGHAAPGKAGAGGRPSAGPDGSDGPDRPDASDGAGVHPGTRRDGA